LLAAYRRYISDYLILLLAMLSTSYGDETDLLENEEYQQSERHITPG
jgi:hypothetical protein